MTRPLYFATIPLLLLGLGSAARSSELSSGVFLTAGFVTATCFAVNVGKKTRSVTIEIVDVDGEVDASEGFELEPGSAQSVSLASAEGPIERYCRIDLKGSRKNIRGSFFIRETAGLLPIAALPVQ